MNPFQDPTRPERGPMNLDDSDLQGLGETYRPLCAQRRWAAIKDEPLWHDVALTTATFALALAVCAGVYVWFKGGFE